MDVQAHQDSQGGAEWLVPRAVQSQPDGSDRGGRIKTSPGDVLFSGVWAAL